MTKVPASFRGFLSSRLLAGALLASACSASAQITFIPFWTATTQYPGSTLATSTVQYQFTPTVSYSRTAYSNVRLVDPSGRVSMTITTPTGFFNAPATVSGSDFGPIAAGIEGTWTLYTDFGLPTVHQYSFTADVLVPDLPRFTFTAPTALAVMTGPVTFAWDGPIADGPMNFTYGSSSVTLPAGTDDHTVSLVPGPYGIRISRTSLAFNFISTTTPVDASGVALGWSEREVLNTSAFIPRLSVTPGLPVPEPASFGWIAAGFAVLGIALRWRRSRLRR